MFVLLEAYKKLANNTDNRQCLEKQGSATGECLHAMHPDCPAKKQDIV